MNDEMTLHISVSDLDWLVEHQYDLFDADIYVKPEEGEAFWEVLRGISPAPDELVLFNGVVGPTDEFPTFNGGLAIVWHQGAIIKDGVVMENGPTWEDIASMMAMLWSTSRMGIETLDATFDAGPGQHAGALIIEWEGSV